MRKHFLLLRLCIPDVYVYVYWILFLFLEIVSVINFHADTFQVVTKLALLYPLIFTPYTFCLTVRYMFFGLIFPCVFLESSIGKNRQYLLWYSRFKSLETAKYFEKTKRKTKTNPKNPKTTTKKNPLGRYFSPALREIVQSIFVLNFGIFLHFAS